MQCPATMAVAPQSAPRLVSAQTTRVRRWPAVGPRGSGPPPKETGPSALIVSYLYDALRANCAGHHPPLSVPHPASSPHLAQLGSSRRVLETRCGLCVSGELAEAGALVAWTVGGI